MFQRPPLPAADIPPQLSSRRSSILFLVFATALALLTLLLLVYDEGWLNDPPVALSESVE